MAKEGATEKLTTGQPATDFQLFQVSALASVVDMVRYRLAHLEVTMKGEKAGPYEASQIPPPLSANKAYELLQRIWKGCSGEMEPSETLLIGVAKADVAAARAESGGEPVVAVPGLEDGAFELEVEKPKPEENDDVVTLEAAEGEDEDEDEDSGVFELE